MDAERSPATGDIDPLWRRCASAVYRGCSLAVRATRDGVIGFYNSNNLTFAASIAYYSLLSMFPFLLLVLTVLGRIPVNEGPTLLQLVSNALPSRFDFLAQQLDALAGSSLNLSLAGTLVTLWASTGVFGAITSAVNHAWGVEHNYSFLKHKLVAFIMMLAAGLLAVVALTLASAAQVAEANWFAGVLTRYPELRHLSGLIYANAITPAFIVVVGLVYYYVPNTHVRLRDVWFGAILAGVLWRAAFSGFAFYVRDLSRFTVHGSVAAVVIFLIWIYLCAVILLYGVEVTAAWARLRLEARLRKVTAAREQERPASRQSVPR